jgi:hypothetical protein
LIFSKKSVSPKLVSGVQYFGSFMEETDVGYPTPTSLFLQQAIPNGCPAKTMSPSQRMELGIQVVAGQQPISELAKNSHTSRQFVKRQGDTAKVALEQAFTPELPDDHVLTISP